MTRAFKPCHYLGLYPLVDSAFWVGKLALLGVKSIQLRIKSEHANLEEEIKKSIELAKKHQVTLFINDHWKLAIRFGAAGIHLGQQDLATANIEDIRMANMLLGVSAYCQEEIDNACEIGPSYVAIGPVYATTSKELPIDPHGVERLRHWQKSITYPVVAIGGMTLERIPTILDTGVCGIALISAITKAADPAIATRELLRLFD